MTRTPKAASAARTGPSTTDSDAAAARAPAAAIVRAPLASTAELPQTSGLDGFVRSRPRAPPPVPPPPRSGSALARWPTKDDSDSEAAPPAPAPAPANDESDSDSSSDGEIPLCDAPVVKKRKVETVATSRVKLTDSERYKKDDAGCAERLKKREADQLLPCRDPDEGEDDGGIGDRFQGYDGFTIKGPPVFR